MVKLKREQQIKDDKTLTVLKFCVITFFITFLGKRENLGRSNDAKRSKTGNSLRGQKKLRHAHKREPWTNKNKGSKLIAAYLPVGRLTILDRLVCLKSGSYNSWKNEEKGIPPTTVSTTACCIQVSSFTFIKSSKILLTMNAACK